MKRTLLDLTQSILSALDSDEVNSISDTTESLQVAEVIRTAYFNIIARTNLPEHKQIFQLEASNNINQPTLMVRPDTANRVEWIKYKNEDQDDQYQYVTIVPLEQFMDMTQGLNVDESNVGTLSLTIDGLSFVFKFQTDRQPTYCTVIKDRYFIFDAYNESYDDTLKKAKTMCFGEILPVFTLSDNFIPDMDDQQFPLLLNEAKSLAFLELKQMQHPKADQEAKRQWHNLQRMKSVAEVPSYFDQLPNFGRSGNRYSVRSFRQR